ncbi:hypothetical protein P5F54_11740 [Clostridium perfringens]|nr:hypothetical protein [Clostridium perfringens]
MQIKNNKLPNTMNINENLVVVSILYTTLFLTIYYIVRFKVNLLKYKLKPEIDIKLFNISKLIIYIIFFVVLIPQLTGLINNILGHGINISVSDGDKIKNMIIRFCFFLMPLYILSYNIYIVKNKKKNTNWISILFSFLLLILVKNFFVENRGTVAPIYLALFIYIFDKKLNIKTIFLILIMIFIIGYPVVEQIVHSNISLTDFVSGDETLKQLFEIDYLNHFTQLDYDAWSNFMATIEYVKVFGFKLGNQLMGSALFFVPRYIWPNKPVATGETVGRFLMDNTGMWFYNLSNPIMSEGYIDFGVLGIIIYAIILAILAKKIKNMIASNSYKKFVGIFISMQMFLFLRGDMLSSISYFLSSIIAIYVIPKFLDKILSTLLIKK